MQGPLYPSPSAPHPSQSHSEELWNVRIHVVNAPSGVRGANPLGRGKMLILRAGQGWSRNVSLPRIIGTGALDRSCFVF